MEKITNNTNRTAELLEAYRLELVKVWGTGTEYRYSGDHMVKWAMNKASQIIPLSTGLYVIEKKSLETRFCFGYGWYGRSDEEEDRAASSMAHHAATSENYFKVENLKDLDEWLTTLKEYRDEYDINWADGEYFGMYSYTAYPDYQPDLVHIADGQTIRREYFSGHLDWSYKGLKQLSREDVEKLIEAFEIEKVKRTKKVDAYLKKYGLSKVETWTYLRD